MIHAINESEAKTTASECRWESRVDLVVLGSGAAGLTAALRAHELGLRVLVVTKDAIDTGSTRYAQGGVAVVLDDVPRHEDSVEGHVGDTIRVGGGLCDPAVVRSVLRSGPAAVSRLREHGAVFDQAVGTVGIPARTREGGHNAFRVLHAGGDATGAEVERALVARTSTKPIPVLRQHIAVDTVRTPSGAVAGVEVLDDNGTRGRVRARAVLVATGGLGQLYRATSNPSVATGDGFALALRAGAQLADLEFVQFHPTVFYTAAAGGTRPLVTEALRGEGATLVDATGRSVTSGIHPLGDLAPRDVVAAAATRRMAAAPGGVDSHVYLDATGVAGFADRFPTVHASCAAAGIDPAREPIPVAPAAHFSCGGVATDATARTGVTGLYAAGEVARTGLHGANRLASNSLLEGLVMGERAAASAAADAAAGTLADPEHGRASSARPVAVAPRASLQRVMSRYAAIGRSADGLDAAAAAVDLAAVETTPTTHREVEDASLTLLGRAVLVAAARRTETRGCHVRSDHTGADDGRWRWSQSVRLSPSGGPVLAGDAIRKGVAA